MFTITIGGAKRMKLFMNAVLHLGFAEIKVIETLLTVAPFFKI
jgi:hypothetical protein